MDKILEDLKEKGIKLFVRIPFEDGVVVLPVAEVKIQPEPPINWKWTVRY